MYPCFLICYRTYLAVLHFGFRLIWVGIRDKICHVSTRGICLIYCRMPKGFASRAKMCVNLYSISHNARVGYISTERTYWYNELS